MRRSEWSRHGFEALKKTANLISLTILIVASVLTFDLMLLSIGLAVEVIYLSWASRSGDRGRRDARRDESCVLLLDRMLLVVSVAGVVVILFFGFGKHLLSHPWPYLTHAEGWEAGAIVWTWLFLLYYNFKFRLTNRPNIDAMIKLVIAVASWPLLQRAWNSMGRPIEHVVYILLISFCLLVIDFLIVKYHPEAKERNLSRSSLLWADIPMVTAFLVLLAYLCLHRDTESPDIFTSGIISCQLLISNSVFVVMEFGLLQSPKASADGLAAPTVPVAGE